MELPEMINEWAHILLEWVGFGTLVGLLAKAIMPGRDPGGAVATILLGIGGAVIGAGAFAYFLDQRISPVSWIGFGIAVAGAFVLLFFYRLLSGYFFVEGDDGRYHYRRRVYRRRRAGAMIED